MKEFDVSFAPVRALVEHTIAPGWSPPLLGSIVIIRLLIVLVSWIEVQLSFSESSKDGVVAPNTQKLFSLPKVLVVAPLNLLNDCLVG